MLKYVLFFFIFIMLPGFSCRRPKQIDRIAVIYNFEHTEIEKYFKLAVARTADSLSILAYLVHDTAAILTNDDDTLFSKIDAIAAPHNIENAQLAKRIAKQRKTPIIRYNGTLFDDNNFYQAGRKAGRYVTQLFGPSGRFGILTASLDNAPSNESIRGFREELVTAHNTWKQVNIISYGDEPDRAIRQFQDLNRFGARTIWFLADGNQNISEMLKTHKKNNYFIAVDLHASKNYIKLIQDESWDAVATQNVKAMGQQCVLRTAQALNNEAEFKDEHFKVSILINTDNGLKLE